MKRTVIIICMIAILCEMTAGANTAYASRIGTPATSAGSAINKGKPVRPASRSDNSDYEVEEYVVRVNRTKILLEGYRLCYIPVSSPLPQWLYKGDIVFVRQITNGWARIRLPFGWARVAARDLAKSKDDGGSGSTTSLVTRKYKVTVKSTVIRKGAGSYFPSAGHLRKNDIVHVRKFINGWAKFKYRGKWRYVKKSHLRKR